MILGFRDDRTRRLAEGHFVREFQGCRDQAIRKLSLLDNAPSLEAVGRVPGNNLKVLTGDRRGRFSIRINRQWRICFVWPAGQAGPSEVEVVDYH